MLHTRLPRVLCIGCSPNVFAGLNGVLRQSNLYALAAATCEQAVAVCVAEVISLAIVDCEALSDGEWSVAQSLKMVRPALPVILLENDQYGSGAPEGVDAVIGTNAPKRDLLNKVHELLKISR